MKWRSKLNTSSPVRLSKYLCSFTEDSFPVFIFLPQQISPIFHQGVTLLCTRGGRYMPTNLLRNTFTGSKKHPSKSFCPTLCVESKPLLSFTPVKWLSSGLN